MATVMLVGDSAFMRNMLKDILVKEGHEVIVEASNGGDAVDKYKEMKPELVLMDTIMHSMDGVEAVRRIVEYDPRAKIVMCSAYGGDEMIIDAFHAGALSYIVKPFKPSIVKEIIEKVLDICGQEA